jgi:tRNA G10  N-methylase Trm11
LSIYSDNARPVKEKEALALAKGIANDLHLERPRGKSPLALSSNQSKTLLKQGKKELSLTIGQEQAVLSRIVAVQDIDAYTLRDMGRPHLLKKTGMLPPKLAQILINLSGVTKGRSLIDPFCGSGLVIQEASLQGIKGYGLDIHPRTVELCRENLEWARTACSLPLPPDLQTVIRHGDATDTNIYRKWGKQFDAVVTEGELGPNFSSDPDQRTLDKIIKELLLLNSAFLRAIHPYIVPKGRLVCCFPVWNSVKGAEHKPFRLFPLISQKFNVLGYTIISPFPKGLGRDTKFCVSTLFYERPSQRVGREIVILEKSNNGSERKFSFTTKRNR